MAGRHGPTAVPNRAPSTWALAGLGITRQSSSSTKCRPLQILQARAGATRSQTNTHTWGPKAQQRLEATKRWGASPKQCRDGAAHRPPQAAGQKCVPAQCGASTFFELHSIAGSWFLLRPASQQGHASPLETSLPQHLQTHSFSSRHPHPSRALPSSQQHANGGHSFSTCQGVQACLPASRPAPCRRALSGSSGAVCAAAGSLVWCGIEIDEGCWHFSQQESSAVQDGPLS